MLLQVLQRSNIIITHKHKIRPCIDFNNQDSNNINPINSLFNQDFLAYILTH